MALSRDHVKMLDMCSRGAVSKHRTLQPFEGAKPQLGRDIFVAPNASVIGDVRLDDQSSVWYGAILRGAHPILLHTGFRLRCPLAACIWLSHWHVASCSLLPGPAQHAHWLTRIVARQAGDVNSITVGQSTNIQDCAVVHVARHALGEPAPTVIGNNVTIGARRGRYGSCHDLFPAHLRFL